MSVEQTIFQIGITLFVSMLFGAILSKYKQSPIVGFILGGILLGPVGLGFIQESEIIELFSEIGVLMLLFYIGLEVNIDRMKEGGLAAFVLAPAEMIAMFLIGFGVTSFFGFSLLEAVFMGLIVMMSSTAIIGKYMMDNDLTKKLEAGIIIPELLIQDVVAVMALALLPLAVGQGTDVGTVVLNTVAFVVVSLLIANELSKVMISTMEQFDWKHHIVLFGLGFVLTMAFIADFFGLSSAIGAFLGGFLLSQLKHTQQFEEQLSTFRDFFSAFFFVGIGLFFTVPTLEILLIGVIILVLYVTTKLVMYGFIGPFVGLDTGFSIYLASLMISIGEFSLIIAGLALAMGLPRAIDMINLSIFLVLGTTFLLPILVRASPKITELFKLIMPASIHKSKTTLHKIAGGISSLTVYDKTAQEIIFLGLKKVTVMVLAVFATVYLVVFTSLNVVENIIPGIPNNLSLAIGGLIIVIPALYKMFRDVRGTMKELVQLAGPTVFPNFNAYQLQDIETSFADLVVGSIFLGICFITIFVSAYTAFLFVLVPVIFGISGLVYMSKGYYHSRKHYDSLMEVGRVSRKALGGRIEQKL